MNRSKLDDEKLVSNAKRLLDESIDDLDTDTRNRLARARSAAVRQVTVDQEARIPEPVTATGYARVTRRFDYRFPATMAASLALVIGVATYWSSQNTLHHQPVLSADDIAILGSVDEPGLYEDMEFYMWLEGTNQRG